MPAYRSQQDLIDYLTDLERRVTLLERSVTRIDQVSDRTKITAAKGRIIFDTSTNKLYAGDGTSWNALW